MKRWQKLLLWLTIVVGVIFLCAVFYIVGPVVIGRVFPKEAVVTPVSAAPPVVTLSTPMALPTLPAGGDERIPEGYPFGATVLQAKDRIVGYTYPIGLEGPWAQNIPEGGFLLVACGNCVVDGEVGSSDGTIGNVFAIAGVNKDGSTPEDLNLTVELKDYTPGHIQVTFVYAGDEKVDSAGLSAVKNMFGPPNCGAEGCLKVILHIRYADTEWTTFQYLEPPK